MNHGSNGLADKAAEEKGYLVAQLGARMHYAVPRILHEAGLLTHLFTDACATEGWPRLLRAMPQATSPRALRRLVDRVPRGVPGDRITTFPNFGLHYAWRRGRARTPGELAAVYLWAGGEFCKRVLKVGFGDAGGVYTFNGAGLELLEEGRSRGLNCVMEQTIAPRRIERQLMAEERRRHPGWEDDQGPDTSEDSMIVREECEWGQADTILCGSEFVREGIRQAGGPVDRCRVVPYGVDAPVRAIERHQHNDPLRVLTVGQVGLRKGSPYVLEAARLLGDEATFRMVGPIGVTAQAEAALRKYVELTGPVPRSDMAMHYAWADVFLLPSICEGSATVVYEAISTGLPVVCTPNTGSPLETMGVGEIVPIRSGEEIVTALSLFLDTGYLTEAWGCALQASRLNSFAVYAENLSEELRERLPKK